jgi:tRNA-dihydrouridine synthase A
MLTRGEVLERLLPYVRQHLASGGRLNSITRHVLGLYHGQPRARVFRRHLSEHGVGEGPGIDVLIEAIALAEGRASASGAMAAE